jgi:hypothetical protein
MNANLEILEHMWRPSDFTVTGPLKSFDRTADLGALTMPVLFHCGEHDEARPDTVREHAALTPGATVAIIPGAGHLTMLDAPEHANRVIRDFLCRVESSSHLAHTSARSAPSTQRTPSHRAHVAHPALSAPRRTERT